MPFMPQHQLREERRKMERERKRETERDAAEAPSRTRAGDVEFHDWLLRRAERHLIYSDF